MRSATSAVLLFALCALAAPLAGCDLFSADGDPEDVAPSLLEGEYDAGYVARFMFEKGDKAGTEEVYRGELYCLFNGERETFGCGPGRTGQAVTAGGPYEIYEKELFLDDVAHKRADFNWGLSPQGGYDYELAGDTLTLTQEQDHRSMWETRKYHRIVLIKRDPDDYTILSPEDE